MQQAHSDLADHSLWETHLCNLSENYNSDYLFTKVIHNLPWKPWENFLSFWINLWDPFHERLLSHIPGDFTTLYAGSTNHHRICARQH